MPYYKYTSNYYNGYGEKEVLMAQEACFAEIWENIEEIEELSIYVFPEGAKHRNGRLGKRIDYGYTFKNNLKNRPGKLLENFNTAKKLGVKRWSEAISFIPNTSFVSKSKDAIGWDNIPTSTFIFKRYKRKYLSPIMLQIWINAVRYSYEEPYTQIARFTLHYYKPNMTPLELFNLHLLAHYTIVDCPRHHASQIVNPKPYSQNKFNKLMKSKRDAYEGTSSLENEYERDEDTYLIIKKPIGKAVRNAMEKIDVGQKAPSLNELLKIWETSSQKNNKKR